MEDSSKFIVTCPKCHEQFEKEMLVVFDVNKDPSLYARVVSEEIFSLRCPCCGHSFGLTYEFHFVNHDKKYSVHFTTESKNLIELCDSFNVVDGFHHRVVLANRLKAIEKIMLFEKGYDDRVIEIAKQIVLSSFLEQHSISDPKLVQTAIIIEQGKATPLFYYNGATYKGSFRSALLKDIPDLIAFRTMDDEDYIVDDRYVDLILYSTKYMPLHYNDSKGKISRLLIELTKSKEIIELYSQNLSFKIGQSLEFKKGPEVIEAKIIEHKLLLRSELKTPLAKLINEQDIFL